jgi:predicted HicB family RNase H-like nuclease
VNLRRPQIANTSEESCAQLQIGRPRREEGRRPSTAKTVRLPNSLWKQITAKAKREKKTLNAGVREALQLWVRPSSDTK